MAQPRHYEEDLGTWPDEQDDGEPQAYEAPHAFPGVALRVLGWETEPDEDTAWSGIESRTGAVLAVMVGDDYRRRFYPDDLRPIPRASFCAGCGQIGCHCDAYGQG